MSDNIPFDIQMEIIKKVYDVKSLVQFRSVSKPWKSFIDSSDFIKGYGARHTQPHRRIVSLLPGSQDDNIFLVDDNIESLEVKEFAPSFVVSPLLKQYRVNKVVGNINVVGACHGLLCLHGYNKHNYRKMLVIWNYSIGKSFGIAVPGSYRLVFGFGVCPDTRDPTVVKILCEDNKPWHVEVFTLSSGVWNVIPNGNLPRQTIRLNPISTQVVIDRFIYWAAWETTSTKDMVVSFDLITKEFKVVDLPDSFTKELCSSCFISKLRESLVVCGYVQSEEGIHSSVWVMEHDLSFRKLFTIGIRVDKILGFKKNGETIFTTRIEGEDTRFTTLDVYDPYSQQIKNLGIFGIGDSFFMGSYMESLLLLDHLDSHIYYDNNRSK